MTRRRLHVLELLEERVSVRPLRHPPALVVQQALGDELLDLAGIVDGRDHPVARARQAGAVDYIVKPFSPMELRARIRAALRRQVEPEPYLLGDLEIHYEERRVSVAGRTVQLTTTEYELLRVLSRNAGRVSSHEDLLHQVWGGNSAAGGSRASKRLSQTVHNPKR